MPHFSSSACLGSFERKNAANLCNSSGVSASISALMFSILSLILWSPRLFGAVRFHFSPAQKHTPRNFQRLESPLLDQPGDCLPRHPSDAGRFRLSNPLIRLEVRLH